MWSRLRRRVLTFALIMVLLNMGALAVKTAYGESLPVAIDVFTQKQPYDGKGPNAASDAIGPEECVTLYALVTYNQVPVDNGLVAFNVRLPTGRNFTVSARTNMTGIATTEFVIMTPPIKVNESDIFGVWFVTGNVMVNEEVFEDNLTFKVDWIVKLLSVRTIDENRSYQNSFGRGGDVGLEIVLRSVAMTLRNATIAVVVQDEVDIVVNFSMVQDFLIQPNEKLIFLYYKATIASWSHVGIGTVEVNALTETVEDNGVVYCPSVTASFQITGLGAIRIDYRDAAVVMVSPSSSRVKIGHEANLTTLVRNEGTIPQNFSVTTYFDNHPLGTSQLTDLPPYSVASFSFTLNATQLTLGNHTISASIPPVPDEADPTDNTFMDTVEVYGVHDVAVLNVQPSSNLTYIGEVILVIVDVRNLGDFNESFTIRASYDSGNIGETGVNDLAPGAERVLTFAWNTYNVTAGNYTVSAMANPVDGEINLANNLFTDGIVDVRAYGQGKRDHDVAVTSVVPSSDFVYIGDILDVDVAILNNGTNSESFDVILRFDVTHEAGIMHVADLQPDAIQTLTFSWNTSQVPVGNHTVSAYAVPVADETFTENNVYSDGSVKFVEPTKGLPLPDWFLWLLIILILIILAIILFILLSRRRRKSEESFSTGWTAWYYGYDISGRTGQKRYKRKRSNHPANEFSR